MGDAGPVYAIQSPEIAGFLGASYNFETLCRQYSAEIVGLYPAGPLRLAGWSMGGALALRMAAILEGAGREIEWVGLIDTLISNNTVPIRFADFLSWSLLRVQADSLCIDHFLAASHARLQRLTQEQGIDRVVQMLSDDPLWLSAQGIDAAYLDFLRKQHQIQQRHAELMKEFEPAAIHAPMHVAWAEESRRNGAITIDWAAFSQTPKRSTQCVLQGNHDNLILLEENILYFSKILLRQSGC